MPIYAEEKPEFLEPLNGASVDSEFNRIRIRIPKSGEIHFILDGDKKFTSAGVGECFAALPEKLCMGIHTLEANILYKFYEWPNRYASKRKAYQYMFEAIWKF